MALARRGLSGEDRDGPARKSSGREGTPLPTCVFAVRTLVEDRFQHLILRVFSGLCGIRISLSPPPAKKEKRAFFRTHTQYDIT